MHQLIIERCPKVHVHFVFRSDQRKMGAIILAERHKHNHGANVLFSPPLSGVCIPVCYTCPRLPQRDHRRDQKHLQSSQCVTCPWSLHSVFYSEMLVGKHPMLLSDCGSEEKGKCVMVTVTPKGEGGEFSWRTRTKQSIRVRWSQPQNALLKFRHTSPGVPVRIMWGVPIIRKTYTCHAFPCYGASAAQLVRGGLAWSSLAFGSPPRRTQGSGSASAGHQIRLKLQWQWQWWWQPLGVTYAVNLKIMLVTLVCKQEWLTLDSRWKTVHVLSKRILIGRSKKENCLMKEEVWHARWKG